jgi:hypothetical protein
MERPSRGQRIEAIWRVYAEASTPELMDCRNLAKAIISADPATAFLEAGEWVSVETRKPILDAESCCMDESDYGRFSIPVQVFDEDSGNVRQAFYDSRHETWHSVEVEEQISGVTHWQPLPSPPSPAKESR